MVFNQYEKMKEEKNSRNMNSISPKGLASPRNSWVEPKNIRNINEVYLIKI